MAGAVLGRAAAENQTLSWIGGIFFAFYTNNLCELVDRILVLGFGATIF